jgi:hypothetical protein
MYVERMENRDNVLEEVPEEHWEAAIHYLSIPGESLHRHTTDRY